MKSIMIATKNKGKEKEYRELLAPLGYEVRTLLDFPDIPDIEETGQTFLENAMIKAKQVAKICQIPVLADDSGLEVEALNNRPGVYSRRYAGTGNDLDNNQKLLKEMEGKTNRKARFVCQIVYMEPDKPIRSYEGVAEGTLAYELHPGNGFGYDPLFYVFEAGKYMSQLATEEKNKISHRGKALAKLVKDLADND
ncbi:MAG TPA: XTP/dITP diphosphatase [Candidatus Izemoplasmatales bacterium]|nr:XTP/dITP diphosphatase [Candidatus Izemoplasmatales bacterium]